MDVLDIPVCPGCGAPAVGDARCSNCSTRLAGLERLPTRREWELSQPAPGDPGWGTYDPHVADDELVPEPEPEFHPTVDQRFAGRPLAGWGRRTTGFLVDVLVAWAGSVVVGIPAFALLGDSVAGPVTGGGIVVAWLLNTIVLARLSDGRTVGKRVTGLRLVRDDGRPPGYGVLALRELARAAMLTAGAGIVLLVDAFWAMGDGRQTLRDKTVSTRVIREA